jgi:hypothetical protein
MSAMNKAWAILKRQTELGEFHPDFPSSYGPVRWLHGTPQSNIDSIRRRGILENDGQDYGFGAFVTKKPASARHYARTAEPRRAPVAYVGVREGAGEPEKRGMFGSTEGHIEHAFPKTVSPEFLTVMPKSPNTETMYRADALGQEEFQIPAEDVRLRNYMDRLTGDNQYELQRIQDAGRTIDDRGAEYGTG